MAPKFLQIVDFCRGPELDEEGLKRLMEKEAGEKLLVAELWLC